MIGKAMNVARMLIAPEHEQQLIKGFLRINNSSLNRANKQKIVTLIE
jgi:hypothetical protein